MEDAPIQSDSRTGYGGGGERRAFSSASSFGGDRGGGGDRSTFDRGGMSYAVREQLPLPSKPPYTSHLGNLPFDATNGDIEDFFAGCEVTSIRIVEDKMDRKPKGFGYVEFGTLEGLKKALELNGEQFQGRGIRISVADPPKDRVEAREITDWSRKGPLPDLPGNNTNRRASERTGGGFGERRGYENAPEMERGGSRRGGGFESDGKERDFSNWERKGPLSPAPAAAQSLRDGGRIRSRDGPDERKNSPAWGEGQGRQGSQEGSRPPRREFQERPPPVERQPTAADLDSTWRARMKPDAPAKSATPTPEPSQPSSPAQANAPAARPRLNLAKRTVSEAVPESAATPTSDAKASPFGAARPVDTATKEKEVEEKRQLAIRQKKEEDDKAREEKKEAAAKAAAEASKDTSENGEEKNGDAPKVPTKILSRGDNEEQGAEKDTAETSTNGDAPAKPTDFVREPPKGPRAEGGGSTWRGSARGGRGGERGERGGRGRGGDRGDRSFSGRGGDRGDRSFSGRGGGDRGDRGDRSFSGRGDRKPSAPSTPISPKIGSTAETVDEDGFTIVQKPTKGRGGARVGGA
ncbi:RNA-binding domain-containing protein [Tothia fuscella]|uniref:RNA-binding domain-containing protein n=1 Tax=Tothia fuscella TaxID=1048955 RepID=A0A9P4TYA4_9PEZI|nr:RNA-binding domain-containing protein [Tothia fuscella]